MANRIRILLIEDNEDDAALVKRALDKHGIVEDLQWVSTESAFRQAIETRSFDLILSDYTVPGFGAPQALEILRSRDRLTPFVVISGTIGEERAAEIIRIGANDFLIKKRLDGLWVVIERALREARERRRAEEERVRLTTAIENAADSIVITDPEGHVVYVNPAFQAISGYASSEVIGMRPNILKSGRHPDAFYAELWDTIKQGRVWRGRMVNRRKDGTFYDEDSTIAPVLDGNGEIVNFVAVKRDVTKERELLERSRQQQRLEALGTLAGGVAHEINNPIQGIMNFAELIAGSAEEGTEAFEFAREIIRETNRVAQIVKNLLMFASQEKQIHKAASVQDILDTVLSLFQSVTRHAEIILDVDVPAGLPTIRCRPQQIEQVLLNLMANARDALNERYPGFDPNKIMRISAHLLDTGIEERVCLVVEDHGAGIAKEVADRIFDPFFTTKPRGLGTGLGLSISHGIVKDHDGDIRVESIPGESTRFTVEIPVWTDYDTDSRPAILVEEVDPDATHSGS